jgi:putative oxidoreductase
MEKMNSSSWDDTGKLLLRITIGGLMLFHGIAKLLHGVDPIVAIVKENGLPEYFAYGVYVGEMLAPALILIGWWTRLAALVFAFNMAASVWLVLREKVFTLNEVGGWAIELNALYFLGALAIFFLGAGHYSIDGCPWRNSAGSAPPATGSGAKQL